MTKPMTRLVIDTANILFGVATAHGKTTIGSNASAEDKAGLAMHMALMTIRSQYNKVKPDQVAITFEGSKNWRKAYTRGERAETPVSGRIYKANRVKDDSMIPFFELMTAFEDLARNHTSLNVISHPNLEGDDSFAAYARKYCALGDTVVGLSNDKDFTTLLQLPNFKLLTPDGKYRGLDKKTGAPIDPEFFMYMKAFRGDAGDNVLPALPRVFESKLQKAFDALKKGDTYLHDNLMNTHWTFTDPGTGLDKEFLVGDLFKENMVLMDLINGQPADIQQLMAETVEHAAVNHGTFSLFHFTKFCGKFGLKRIAEEATNFVPLLSSTGLNSPRKEETKALNAEKKRKTSLVF